MVKEGLGFGAIQLNFKNTLSKEMRFILNNSDQQNSIKHYLNIKHVFVECYTS